MKEWILSISAVVIISAIITLILPEGKIGKFIKGIFSLFIVFTIIKPVFYIKNNDFCYENIFNQNSIDVQYDFIEYVLQEKVEEYESQCLEIIKEMGIINASVDIFYELKNQSDIKIEQANINLKDSVIISDKEHIDIIKEIKNKIGTYLNIKEELVKIYD